MKWRPWIHGNCKGIDGQKGVRQGRQAGKNKEEVAQQRVAGMRMYR